MFAVIFWAGDVPTTTYTNMLRFSIVLFVCHAAIEGHWNCASHLDKLRSNPWKVVQTCLKPNAERHSPYACNPRDAWTLTYCTSPSLTPSLTHSLSLSLSLSPSLSLSLSLHAYICVYTYIYTWWLIKIPLSGNGHSSRIKSSLSRIFRKLHVYLSRNRCWAKTPLMKIHPVPAKSHKLSRKTSS